MNLGAQSETDAGFYFQWGDTQGYTADQVGDGEGKKYFDCEDYKYAELDTNGSDNGSGSGSGSGSGGGTSYRMTKYNDDDGLTVLQPSDDAVAAAWGGNWRMPTVNEFRALDTATTIAWTADYEGCGISGFVLTDKTDESKVLFLPCGGFADNGNVIAKLGHLYGFYSTSNGIENPCNIMCFGYNGYSCSITTNSLRRCNGYSIRGILDE